MSNRLYAVLQTLAAEPRSEHPILSVYLDMSVDNTGQRQALRMLEQELERLAGEIDLRGEARESFAADRERLMQYLDSEAPADARGLVVFACNASRIWVAIPLLVPVETAVAADHYPHVFQLARMLDDYETFVVALVEGQEAAIYALGLEGMEEVERTVASEKINRVMVGGWSQLRYQNHNDHVIRSHMRDLATTLQQVMSDAQSNHLIIAGNTAIKGTLLETLPQPLHEQLVEYMPYERQADAEQLFRQLEPKMQEVERQSEAELLARLEDQLATVGGLALAGEAAIAMALSKGQVDTLLVRPDLRGMAGECPTCGLLRPGQRDNCPIDGSPLQPIELGEALVIHTLRQGGKVEVCSHEEALREQGGVAALLRYRDETA
jgi:peptide subunit release factor 1 (eRF1)